MRKTKKCPVCATPIFGRPDKVFCTSDCRAAYHYENRKKLEEFYFKVDKQLKVNRKLLRRFNRSGETTLNREVLHKLGFDPEYFTHYLRNNLKEVYFFCYDYGYKKISESKASQQLKKYLIVSWQEMSK